MSTNGSVKLIIRGIDGVFKIEEFKTLRPYSDEPQTTKEFVKIYKDQIKQDIEARIQGAALNSVGYGAYSYCENYEVIYHLDTQCSILQSELILQLRRHVTIYNPPTTQEIMQKIQECFDYYLKTFD